MKYNLFYIRFFFCLFLLSIISSPLVYAGGIVLGSTRIIYPSEKKQISISVENTSDKERYLVQSWVENAEGKKITDFIVVPPLFVSKVGDKNTLRIMYTGPDLSPEHESVYYFNAQAIPSVERSSIEGNNTLLLSAVTRIKLFVRPTGLHMPGDNISGELKFHRNNNKVIVNNPTPYYITIIKLRSNNKKVPDFMVAPFGTYSFDLPAGVDRTLTYFSINDYGGISAQQRGEIQ